MTRTNSSDHLVEINFSWMDLAILINALERTKNFRGNEAEWAAYSKLRKAAKAWVTVAKLPPGTVLGCIK